MMQASSSSHLPTSMNDIHAEKPSPGINHKRKRFLPLDEETEESNEGVYGQRDTKVPKIHEKQSSNSPPLEITNSPSNNTNVVLDSFTYANPDGTTTQSARADGISNTATSRTNPSQQQFEHILNEIHTFKSALSATQATLSALQAKQNQSQLMTTATPAPTTQVSPFITKVDNKLEEGEIDLSIVTSDFPSSSQPASKLRMDQISSASSSRSATFDFRGHPTKKAPAKTFGKSSNNRPLSLRLSRPPPPFSTQSAKSVGFGDNDHESHFPVTSFTASSNSHGVIPSAPRNYRILKHSTQEEIIKSLRAQLFQRTLTNSQLEHKVRKLTSENQSLSDQLKIHGNINQNKNKIIAPPGPAIRNLEIQTQQLKQELNEIKSSEKILNFLNDELKKTNEEYKKKVDIANKAAGKTGETLGNARREIKELKRLIVKLKDDKERAEFDSRELRRILAARW